MHEEPSLLVDMPMSQNLPARRRKGSLDMYSDDKVSGEQLPDSGASNGSDNKSLEDWVRSR